MFDLTNFQIQLLAVITNSQNQHGLAVKRTLQDEYDQHLGEEGDTAPIEINHGRMYPNLDELVDMGCLEKGEIDKRTNYYKLTDVGSQLLNDYSDWLKYQIDTNTIDN
mgnify:FL=1